MWGVGTAPFRRAVRAFGFPEGAVGFFAGSADPDPDFGGERRPNPEELHNMLKLGRQADPTTQLILVNDPDADRFAIAERVASTGKSDAAIADTTGAAATDAAWRIFHGNEIGLMLGEWMLRNSTGTDRMIACSTVSS